MTGFQAFDYTGNDVHFRLPHDIRKPPVTHSSESTEFDLIAKLNEQQKQAVPTCKSLTVHQEPLRKFPRLDIQLHARNAVATARWPALAVAASAVESGWSAAVELSCST